MSPVLLYLGLGVGLALAGCWTAAALLAGIVALVVVCTLRIEGPS